ncbi:hypothetical protein D0Z07_5131 [Hyphodiscus hymeniophilus]|uniref:Spindle pole body-associated protein cut12 domain-containing protein n=1 Tax=Hyphodiscus hymeniophilus TaxID=353542 RepID=A0A9P7AWF3_9HELO|nr:hypothetical protein D0Z07_5131 [Hyphodiscus hymeniophilus]
MFNWWMARTAEGNREDESTEIEPPETPAPVFAARAIKSAIFGTPAPLDDETVLEFDKTEQAEEAMPRKSMKDLQSTNISPTKPPGILLTPGTATSRRKTVSFGHEILEKAEKSANENASTKGSIKKRHNSTEVKANQSSKSTRLTRALESVRAEKARQPRGDKSRGGFDSQAMLDSNPKIDETDPSTGRVELRPSKSNQDMMQELMMGDHVDGDMTTDLNEPHSQSGKYWKSEFEQYHDEARAEMKKLTKYKILAKSYAKKKDAEAADLRAKLKEEQRRVANMEEKIVDLSGEIAASGVNGHEDKSPMLIKELARQTAMAVQYRAQVEEFREALEGDDDPDTRSGKTSPHKVQALLDTQRELKKARDQLKEKDVIQDDLRDLKKRLSAAEENTKKLQEENSRLSQELLQADLRLEREIEKSEKRRQASQERLQRKEEALQALQRDYDSLKEALKSQRRDADHILTKRHDQIVELKKELVTRKGTETAAKDLQQALQNKTAEHGKIISDYQRQITRLINTQSEDLLGVALPTKANFTDGTQLARMGADNNEISPLRDSRIPVLSHGVIRPLATLATTKNTLSDHSFGSPGIRPRSSHSALSEITNVPVPERTPQQVSTSMQYTPLAHRLSNLSLDAPDMDLPSLGPSDPSQAPSRAFHEKTCLPSPRPSMFIIPSSPPKRAMTRTHTSTGIARQRSITTLTNASSRLSSLENSRTKSTLPPERAAAAKARLQQKNAEKKRAQGMGIEKENIRN